MGLPFKIKRAVFSRISRITRRTTVEVSGDSSGLADGDYTDVTVGGSGTTITIKNGVVTNAKIADMATKTYKGRTSALTGVPEDVSISNLRADLSINNVTNVAQLPISYLDTDGTLAANSDVKVASQKAGKTYADSKVADNLTSSSNVAPSKDAVNTALALKAPLASPSFTGYIQLPEAGGILLDQVLSADGTFSISKGRIGTLGEALPVGSLIYYKTSDSRWWKADSDVEATSGNVLLAILCVAGNAGDDRQLMLEGVIRADAQFPTFTVGAPIYIGSTSGAMQVAKPTSGFIRVVGYGDTADAIIFAPDDYYYEIGVFTPGTAFGGGTTGITYTAQLGYFTKIARTVVCIFHIFLSSKGSSTGQMTTTGFPYTSDGSTSNQAIASLRMSACNAIGVPSATMAVGATTIQYDQLSTLGTGSSITDATVTNTSVFKGTLTYFV